MGQHAILSPSGASRWLACTPSARLEEKFPDSTGEAAKEGTLAHTLAELLLKHKTKTISKVIYNRDLKVIKENSLYEQVMFEHADNYSVYVLERFAEAKNHTSDAQLFLEQKLDLTDYVPEGFGTGDAIVIADHVMDIIDLKYGKGVPVSAENNKQMMLYSLGALREFDFIYGIDKVRMTIFQPRLESVSIWEISVNDLKDWAINELTPKAQLAFNGDGEYTPGEHCRFCRAKATCKANADFNLGLAKYEFKAEGLLTDEEISDILSRADTFKTWIKGVEEYALNEAVNNSKQWPGYKLVEGRSNRQYLDAGKVANELLANGFIEEQIYSPKELLGITAMEKAIGKEAFKTYLSSLIIKPQGKPTLVPVSDKRPEYNSNESAIADFS